MMSKLFGWLGVILTFIFAPISLFVCFPSIGVIYAVFFCIVQIFVHPAVSSWTFAAAMYFSAIILLAIAFARKMRKMMRREEEYASKSKTK